MQQQDKQLDTYIQYNNRTNNQVHTYNTTTGQTIRYMHTIQQDKPSGAYIQYNYTKTQENNKLEKKYNMHVRTYRTKNKIKTKEQKFRDQRLRLRSYIYTTTIIHVT